MPEITDKDIEDVKRLVRAREITTARNLLSRLQGDRAKRMLVQLNEKYPPEPITPAVVSDPNIEKAKAFIAKGKYDEAEKLLLPSEDPRADMLLTRIRGARAEGGAIAQKAKHVSPVRRFLNGCIVTVAGLMIAAVLIFPPKSPSSNSTALPTATVDAQQWGLMVTVCEYVYDDSGLSSQDLHEACQLEALLTMKIYPKEIERCISRYDEATTFLACLVENDVAFSGEFISDAQ
jgi:hypothetical protein